MLFFASFGEKKKKPEEFVNTRIISYFFISFFFFKDFIDLFDT